MEKIYMENNKKGKKGIIDTSVVLSFVVAIFAIFSIAMAGLSLNQKSGVSYAAPDTLPDSFTFNLLNYGESGTGSQVVGTYGDASKKFVTPIYIANNDANNPIYCVEHNSPVENGTSYSNGDAIVDYGLLYLLNNSAANGVSIVSPNNEHVLGTTPEKKAENSKFVNAWLTQTAIWMYLYETDSTSHDSSSKNYISEEDVDTIKKVTILNHLNRNPNFNNNDNVYVASTTLYNDYIKPLVDKAKSASDVATLKVSKASDDIAQSENKDFYFSDVITIVGDPSDALISYTVSLEGIEGAKAVDMNGAELPETITTGTKFYVRIPAEKVTKEVQKVKVNVNAKFRTLSGKYFNAAGDKQVVVSVKADEKTLASGTEVEFVGTDDTGMNTAQTIYFIGLIVLLCGVGIVYANAKPAQVKQ